MPVTIVIVLATCTLVAYIGTELVRRYALTRGVLDVPNERSSHTAPTPRGGGIAIVGAFFAASLVLPAIYGSTNPLWLTTAVLAPGMALAILGAVDDYVRLAPLGRLAVHLLVACWAVWALGGLPIIPLGTTNIGTGIIGSIVGVIALAWALNLFNFMDGIDGIASTEAITVCVPGALLWYLKTGSNDWITAALLAAAAAGFLILNFPPAKIFMGDSGSCFLGFSIGALSIASAHQAPMLLWAWIILVGVFATDATVTLLRRMYFNERLWMAHRTHAYQHAAVLVHSHRRVTITVAFINMCWLFPIAGAVTFEIVSPLVGVALAYFPLVILALYFKAGSK